MNVAARLIEARCRLLGLIGPAAKRTACQQPQTLVLREDDCRLRGCPDHTSTAPKTRGLPTLTALLLSRVEQAGYGRRLAAMACGGQN